MVNISLFPSFSTSLHCLQKGEKDQKKEKEKKEAENAAKAKGYKTTHHIY